MVQPPFHTQNDFQAADFRITIANEVEQLDVDWVEMLNPNRLLTILLSHQLLQEPQLYL